MRTLAVLLGILLVLPGLCFIGFGVAGFRDGGWLLAGFGAVILFFSYLLVQLTGGDKP